MISPFYLKRKNHINIHIFKTNIETKSEANRLKKLLSSSLEIKQLSIDLEDIDNVLRIEAHKRINEKDIINKIISEGFICEELK